MIRLQHFRGWELDQYEYRVPIPVTRLTRSVEEFCVGKTILSIFRFDETGSGKHSGIMVAWDDHIHSRKRNTRGLIGKHDGYRPTSPAFAGIFVD